MGLCAKEEPLYVCDKKGGKGVCGWGYGHKQSEGKLWVKGCEGYKVWAD